MPKVRYGVSWPDETEDVQIEMYAIQQGGTWFNKRGDKCGHGLSFHYEQMRRCIWPHLDGDHNGQRWHTVIRDTVLASKVTVLMGPGSCGKTHACWIYLCEYFCFPQETCVLVSSTDIRGLRLRVWAEISSLWEQAVKKFDFLPGHMLDSKIAITTDNLEDGAFTDRTTRDFRKGIVGIPTVQNGKFIGLGKWIGIKQKRMRLIADEAPAMGASFLSAFSNLNKNEDFRAMVLGNPNDPLDPLGRAAEPKDGWESHMEPKKTEVWETRFMNGRCVNLIGTDSPNFDFPEDEPTRFKYLISREKIAETLSFFPKDSFEYYSQCIGAMKIGMLARRVLTRALCEKNGALATDTIWRDGARTKVFAVDAAYGGDRCVGGWAEFGMALNGKIMLKIHPPQIVPVVVSPDKEPEEQIAEWIKKECLSLNIPPENVAHDSTGRGSLGTYIARAWSAMTNPIEFGGVPTDRPVSLDHFVTDKATGLKRLKLAKEHYVKFVTELWFSTRYTIEAGQLVGMTSEILEEGCLREWNRVSGDRIELETKREMKERIGRSPDLMDWLVIIVEMARRRGFQISKLANEPEDTETTADYLEELAARMRKVHRAHELNHAA